MDDIVQVVGERIRSFRKERGLSQEELAHQASLHSTYIGQLERGEKNATIESLFKVTNALGITLAELFNNTHSGQKANSIEITQIINILEKMPTKDQRRVLALIELLVDWKDI